jgi:predicted nucleotidyltransferase
MFQLTAEQKVWLDVYREALNRNHPGIVQEKFIYGSKGRAEARGNSDLDVLLIVKNKAGVSKREIRRVGYLLAVNMNILPSILAYTQEEWESRKKSGSRFCLAVERDAVRVL